MSEDNGRAPYKGDRNSLVIAIDFGTTYSGVSYAFLDPGEVPTVRSVNAFRGQEHQNSTKVPTVMYYDRSGTCKAAGAETNDPEIIEQAEDEEWTRLSWFKLHLRPVEDNKELAKAPCSPLPRGKTIEMVLGDFLKYMNTCAKTYITTSHIGADTMLQEVIDRTTYILSHPNGWDGFQQTKLRAAAILGGLIPNTDEGRSRVKFVSEGEASFHWCIDSGLASRGMKLGNNIIIADAGGGTIDVSAFEVTSEQPLRLSETSPSECRLAGSIYVTNAFEEYARELLKDSDYGADPVIECLKEEFDKKTKCLFRSDTRNPSVQFGTPRDNAPEFGIKLGRLQLRKDQVMPFFERSCQAAADAIRTQLVGKNKTSVYLVGGFAASPYLMTELEQRLKDCNVEIKRGESQTAKAVSDGAVGYFLDRFITARVAKFTYGISHQTPFRLLSGGHIRRVFKKSSAVDGKAYIKGKFSVHLQKGTVVEEKTVNKIPLSIPLSADTEDQSFEVELLAYKGNIKNIAFLDQDPDQFRSICTLTACVPSECISSKSKLFRSYKKLDVNVVVCFGTVEFDCYLEWKDTRGNLQRGPVSAAWDG